MLGKKRRVLEAVQMTCNNLTSNTTTYVMVMRALAPFVLSKHNPMEGT